MTLLDKAKSIVEGIFVGEDNKGEKEPINTPDQQKLVEMAYGDFQVFKANRQRIESVWRQEQRFYMGNHWYGLRPEAVSKMRPNSVDNIAWSQIESIVSKLTGWVPQPDFEAQEPNDEQKATELNEYMPYELRCIKFKQKHIRAVRRMVIHGPLIYKTIYDPTVEGGFGQYRYFGNNDIIPVDLGSFFPDPRIKDFIHLQKGAAHIVKTVQPLEYFKERWPKQGPKVKEDNDSSDVEIFSQDDYSLDGFNADRTYYGGTEQKTAGLIEYWYKGKPKMMTDADKQLFQELADQKLSEGKDPSEYLAKARGTMSGIHCLYISTSGVFLEHKAYVYDHGQYPFVARTLFPDEDNVWGKGYMRDMMPPQIMLNKFAEIAVETMAKQGGSAVMYEETAIDAKQEKKWRNNRGLPAAMLPVTDINKVKEMQGVNVPQTVFNMMEYYKEMLQKIPGQFDSANGQANPNITSGEQAKALINASSGRLALAAETIQDALEEVFTQYIELMAQFYTIERIGRVTGKQVAMSRDRLISHAPTEYEVTDPTSGELVSQPVMEEYMPKFDISVNISVERPKDREYAIQTAFNLFNMIDPSTQMPMIDTQAVIYTVENGRMEPMSVIQSRMQKEQQIMMQMQQLQQENQMLNEQLGAMGQQLQSMQQGEMSAAENIMRMQQEQEDRQFNRSMQMQKMDLEAQKVAQMGQRMGVR